MWFSNTCTHKLNNGFSDKERFQQFDLNLFWKSCSLHHSKMTAKRVMHLVYEWGSYRGCRCYRSFKHLANSEKCVYLEKLPFSALITRLPWIDHRLSCHSPPLSYFGWYWWRSCVVWKIFSVPFNDNSLNIHLQSISTYCAMGISWISIGVNAPWQ